MPAEPASRILIVEDDHGIALLQRRRLERAGFQVELTTDVHQALSILRRGGIALVLLDYRLGETTGLDLHRRMKAGGLEVPVILVSGAMEDATIVEALRAGIRDIVVKTSDYLDYLPEAVRGVLRQTAGPALAPTVLRAMKLLVVEDDPAAAELERRHLERAGYVVQVAVNGREASEAARRDDIALAVLDLRLSEGKSGLELFEEWRAEGIDIPAILVTAFPDQAVAIHALRAGIRDFVLKSPDFLAQLSAAVDRVTSQSRIERKLVESELRLASIIGTTLDAILMCDERLRVVLFNRAAEEMFGCSASAAFGRPLTEFVPELTLDAALVRGGHVRERRELDGIRSDGVTLPIEVSVSDVVIHDRRLFTVIARDISERRRAEEKLRDADRRKDEFLGMLAHELRNPLAAVMNAGEVLHRTLEDGRSKKLTAVVRRQARALSRMVDDLLDVSRVTLGKIQLTREPLLFGEVVTRAVESVRDAVAAARLHLDVRIGAEPVWVFGDPMRLEQVVTNLLTNAIKFTSPGGRIVVTAGTKGRDAVLSVRDTGIGIPPALLPSIFDLFVQGDTSLDRSRSGLGIGLALVRQIVALHAGTVAVSSEGPGRGSEFVVRLPVAAQDVREIPETPAAGPTHRRVRVLVVDDQRDVADAVAMLIEALGHSASAVYDGEAALAFSRERAPDAMFVDIGMPRMTGYEVAERVRGDPALKRLQLVALTGYGSDDDRARVAQAGFDLHLTKPVNDADLNKALTAIANAG